MARCVRFIRELAIGGVGLWLLLAVSACGFTPTAGSLGPVTVGSGSSAEQMILGKLTVLALRYDGYQVEDRTGLGDAVAVREALEARDIDICWEYTGDTWAISLHHDLPIRDAHQVYAQVREEDRLNEITWLSPAPCQRRMGVAMRTDDATAKGIVNITDLALYLRRREPNLSLCVSESYDNKAYGTQGLESIYGLRFVRERVQRMSIENGYRALASGDCDVSLGFSTDYQLRGGELILLKDDKEFFQVSGLAVGVRDPVLREYPRLERSLDRLSTLLTQDALIALNRQVALEGRTPEDVAKRFLREHGYSRGSIFS